MKKRDWIEHLQRQNKINQILDKAEITARTPLLPCEDEEKVIRALTNVVEGKPEKEQIGGATYLTVRARGRGVVEKIFNYFRSKQTLAALRKFLKRYSSKEEIIFYLHKQAAYNGAFSLAEPGESPGGEIIVIIRLEEPQEVIKWLTKF